MKRTLQAGNRGAFTLVELLVVITIIGILITLLLPAVQRAREAARQMQCENNLKQLGIGFSNFEAANGGFPPRRWSRSTVGTGGGYAGWGAFLLPFIEQSILYDRYNWEYDFYDPVNKEVVETKLPVFLCPSSPAKMDVTCTGKASTGSSNTDKTTVNSVKGRIDYMAPNGFYPVSTGWGTQVPATFQTGASSNSNNARQALWDSSPSFTPYTDTKTPRRVNEISDGLSNTLLIAETAGWPEQWLGKKRASSDYTTLGTRGCWAAWQSFVYYTYSGDGLTSSYSSPTSGDLISCSINCNNKMQPYAFHPGGAHMLFCDGSVHYVAESLDPLTFFQVTIMDDGMPIAKQYW